MWMRMMLLVSMCSSSCWSVGGGGICYCPIRICVCLCICLVYHAVVVVYCFYISLFLWNGCCMFWFERIIPTQWCQAAWLSSRTIPSRFHPIWIFRAQFDLEPVCNTRNNNCRTHFLYTIGLYTHLQWQLNRTGYSWHASHEIVRNEGSQHHRSSAGWRAINGITIKVYGYENNGHLWDFTIQSRLHDNLKLQMKWCKYFVRNSYNYYHNTHLIGNGIRLPELCQHDSIKRCVRYVRQQILHRFTKDIAYTVNIMQNAWYDFGQK